MRTYLTLLLSLSCSFVTAATWQYQVEVQQAPDKNGKPREPGRAFLWLPPKAETVRGLLISGRLRIESEVNIDPQVRAVCAEAQLGIVYFDPHIDAVFHFWEEGNTAGARWLKALEDLSTRSGHPEIRRVPWITMGHSTAGIFCRNVAYWQPERVAAIIHIKSGNFHSKAHLPPSGSLKGIPLVSMNGQFETFGPESGINPEWGRETQWICAQQDLQKFRAQDPEHLLSEYIHAGDDHFNGSPEFSAFIALFLKKTAQYRLPEQLPPGNTPVPPRTIKAESGWLADPELAAPKNPAAPYGQYKGDSKTAMWLYDQELADAYVKNHRALAGHQALTPPTITWLSEGDGWSFRVQSSFLETMPAEFGGRTGGKSISHAEGPILYRSRNFEPLEQTGPDTFKVHRILRELNVGAYHPGNEQIHEATRWTKIPTNTSKGTTQTIQFAELADHTLEDLPQKLEAKASSNLPVYFEVEYGPVELKDGQLVLSDLPLNAVFPLECKVTAYQIGRRVEPVVNPATPVSRTFQIKR